MVGNTIGNLLRESKSDNAYNRDMSTRVVKAVSSKQWEKHQYQSISDANEASNRYILTNPNLSQKTTKNQNAEKLLPLKTMISSSLNFGPSLTEVGFSELNSSVVSNKGMSEQQPLYTENVSKKQSAVKVPSSLTPNSTTKTIFWFLGFITFSQLEQIQQ